MDDWQAALVSLGLAAEHLACAIENPTARGWQADAFDRRAVNAAELAWGAPA